LHPATSRPGIATVAPGGYVRFLGGFGIHARDASRYFAHDVPLGPAGPQIRQRNGHNLVRAWRYGCADSNPGTAQESKENAPNYSKQAFDILHQRYPDNEWTKKTPYWFN